MSSDIISMRKYLSEYNEFVLFAIASVIDENKIKLYFTEREIEMYSNQTYKGTYVPLTNFNKSKN